MDRARGAAASDMLSKEADVTMPASSKNLLHHQHKSTMRKSRGQDEASAQ